MQERPSAAGPVSPVLVAVDFTPAARAALVTASRLAMCSGVPLKILHVVHTPADTPDYYQRLTPRDSMLPIDALAERMLREFVTETRRRNPQLRILETPDTVLVSGLPATRIPEVARLVDAGQIVMGQNRAGGLFGRLLAPLSERIARRCRIPVTVVYCDVARETGGRPAAGPHQAIEGDIALSR